ncbi:gamma-tubulin complex component 3-like [Hetaerina americana]|uniref:gamma-tubulin complex component 3-like n=1 Tax=Hetaerina americana TaxID=62018 RepID=UPI003A7F32E6
MPQGSPDGSNAATLLHKLCLNLSGKNQDDALLHYRKIFGYISQCSLVTNAVQDEFYIVEKIKKKLIQENREQDARKFCELHRKLQRGQLVKNRPAVLILLLHLSDNATTNDTFLTPMVKEPCVIYQLDRPSREQRNTVGSELRRKGSHTTGSRNSSMNIPTIEEMFPPYWSTTTDKISSNERITSKHILSNSRELQTGRKTGTSDHFKTFTDWKNSGSQLSTVSERALLKEVIYSFQGIEGNILKNDPVNGGFKIDPKVGLSKPEQNAVLRAAELGWLHNFVKQHCDDRNMCKTAGLVSQSLVAALRQELTEYYRLVAILEAQLQQENAINAVGEKCDADALTLRRLAVWAIEPAARLHCLLAVAEATKASRGGALAGGVHAFLHHGDPLVRETMKHILGAVCKPLYVMLSRWILDGEIDDPYGEFFIASDSSVKGDRLWHEKYSIRETMLPTFISMSQAKKILSTGKSINFLREVCEDHTPLRGREALKQALEKTSVEALFMEDRDGGLQAMMDTAYRETSLRVLTVMKEQYCFQDHLLALRQFLLLGQGDFIRYLMELLEPELGKPASNIYHHNISGILESAIRATNVKHQSSDVLNRLDVHQLEVAPGDIGWDVFSLDYHVDGPIGAIFTPKEITTYLMLFNTLWRAKRMEWILSCMWKRQVTSVKMLRKLPELRPIQQQMHLLISEMVHFVHQMQYYILFEVLECSWSVLMPQIQQAEALDDIINAHSAFLQTVAKRTLLNSDTKDLLTQLRAVYDLILQLRGHEDVLHERAFEELAAKDPRVKEKVVAAGPEAEKDWDSKRKDFTSRFLPTARAQLKILAQSYQDVVKRFLLSLASQPDVSLQLLSSRLDFNEHYKKRDSRLIATLTYQHRRMTANYGVATGSPLK